jgi:hypothetical protein
LTIRHCKFTSQLMLRYVIGLLAILCLAGCEKQSGEAVVLAKEHIAASSIENTPGTENSASPNESKSNDEQLPPMSDNEITVDGYVMKPQVRGTSRDPRALKDEQWLVKVRMIHAGRTFNLQADQVQFDKLKEGDRVHVSYRIGKYTKTVWGAKIEENKK